VQTTAATNVAFSPVVAERIRARLAQPQAAQASGSQALLYAQYAALGQVRGPAHSQPPSGWVPSPAEAVPQGTRTAQGYAGAPVTDAQPAQRIWSSLAASPEVRQRLEQNWRGQVVGTRGQNLLLWRAPAAAATLGKTTRTQLTKAPPPNSVQFALGNAGVALTPQALAGPQGGVLRHLQRVEANVAGASGSQTFEQKLAGQAQHLSQANASWRGLGVQQGQGAGNDFLGGLMAAGGGTATRLLSKPTAPTTPNAETSLDAVLKAVLPQMLNAFAQWLTTLSQKAQPAANAPASLPAAAPPAAAPPPAPTPAAPAQFTLGAAPASTGAGYVINGHVEIEPVTEAEYLEAARAWGFPADGPQGAYMRPQIIEALEREKRRFKLLGHLPDFQGYYAPKKPEAAPAPAPSGPSLFTVGPVAPAPAAPAPAPADPVPTAPPAAVAPPPAPPVSPPVEPAPAAAEAAPVEPAPADEVTEEVSPPPLDFF
jgi:hypothetical protein